MHLYAVSSNDLDFVRRGLDYGRSSIRQSTILKLIPRVAAYEEEERARAADAKQGYTEITDDAPRQTLNKVKEKSVARKRVKAAGNRAVLCVAEVELTQWD